MQYPIYYAPVILSPLSENGVRWTPALDDFPHAASNVLVEPIGFSTESVIDAVRSQTAQAWHALKGSASVEKRIDYLQSHPAFEDEVREAFQRVERRFAYRPPEQDRWLFEETARLLRQDNEKLSILETVEKSKAAIISSLESFHGPWRASFLQTGARIAIYPELARNTGYEAFCSRDGSMITVSAELCSQRRPLIYVMIEEVVHAIDGQQGYADSPAFRAAANALQQDRQRMEHMVSARKAVTQRRGNKSSGKIQLYIDYRHEPREVLADYFVLKEAMQTGHLRPEAVIRRWEEMGGEMHQLSGSSLNKAMQTLFGSEVTDLCEAFERQVTARVPSAPDNKTRTSRSR